MSVEMPSSLVKRPNSALAAGTTDEYIDIIINEGEIIASVWVFEETSACITGAYYYAGQQPEKNVQILPRKLQPNHEARSATYPFGRKRLRQGKVRAIFIEPVAGDTLAMEVTVEQRLIP